MWFCMTALKFVRNKHIVLYFREEKVHVGFVLLL
jgi:hypothetical protein